MIEDILLSKKGWLCDPKNKTKLILQKATIVSRTCNKINASLCILSKVLK